MERAPCVYCLATSRSLLKITEAPLLCCFRGSAQLRIFFLAVSVSVRQVIARRLEGGKSGVFVTSSPTSRESQLIYTPEFRLHTRGARYCSRSETPQIFPQPAHQALSSPDQTFVFCFLSLENSLNSYFFHKYLFILLLF